MNVSALSALAVDLGHPCVTFSPALTIEGAEGWARVLGGVSPPPLDHELRRLLALLLATDGLLGDDVPTWCVPELVASAAGRARLKAWAAAGRPVPDAYTLVKEARFVGDAEVRGIVLGALLDTVAPPVAWAALAEAWVFVAVGWSATGWLIRCAMPPGDALTLIPLCGAARDARTVRDVVLHELAHAHLMPTPERPVGAAELTNRQDLALLHAVREPEKMADLLARQDINESQADALARAWGGRIACSAHRAAHYTKREGETLAARFRDVP